MAQPTIAYRTAILVVSSLVCSYQNMLILDLMIAWISLRMSELYIPTHTRAHQNIERNPSPNPSLDNVRYTKN